MTLSYEKVQSMYRMFEEVDGDLDPDFFDACLNIKPDHVAAISNGFIVIPNIFQSSAILAKHFDADEIEALIHFGEYAQTFEIVFDLADTCSRYGCTSIRNPISTGMVYTNTSVFCSGVNFLRFKVNEEIVYLIQHDLAAEAVFFPGRGIVVGFGDFQSPYGKIKRLVTEIFKRCRGYSDYFRGDRCWGGVYVGSRSPYHYFYFDLPVLFYLEHKRHINIPNVYTLKEEMYIDPVGALCLSSGLRLFKDGTDLSMDLLENRRFIFLVGRKMEAWSLCLQIDSMNSGIIDYAVRDGYSLDLKERNSGTFTIWVGISGGKRVWVEEVDALRELILELNNHYDSVDVIIDGWTDVEHTSGVPALYGGDEGRAKELISGLPPSVKVKSLVGAGASRKIRCALEADFFVTSHGTASLFVSRICGVPGITHISNAARLSALKFHVHPNAKLVPESIVYDVKTGTETTGYHVNYSMKVPEFLRFVKDILF